MSETESFIKNRNLLLTVLEAGKSKREGMALVRVFFLHSPIADGQREGRIVNSQPQDILQSI